ncbi:cobalamin B12-binding domain-containing protein [Streptomyces sp. NPDC087908]|uniref:cobalamin B12-binding domain-containing protein n=1 Tax=unclassified Streptomyces TaxID=2593676 RepID=UPI0011CE4D0F|nr:cobalamin-dependent protein [Streptomyces sp. adm13(2018)]MYS10710.1 methylmalonyl-CoA mutase [Streptomyces sp. SID6041]TXS26176.1 methylmalonyl-CoA mutase [Streptomyces sp. adm13(2018)]
MTPSARPQPLRSSPEPSRRVLLTTGSSDAHTWNLVHLQLFLEEHGHSVLNLGPCVPEQLLVDTARMTSPDLVVLSSVNGHGHQDGLRAARALRADRKTRGLPMVIGGLLGISPEGAATRTAELLDAGYDEVYADGTPPTALLRRLAELGGACTGRAAA